MYSLSSSGSGSWLSWFLKGLLILSFLILTTKLFEIQIIKGSYYQSLAKENRIRHIAIPAPRGTIYSRDGEVLAGNIAVKKKIKFDPTKGYSLDSDIAGAQGDEVVIDYKRTYPLAEKFAHASGYIGKVDEKEVGTINPGCPEKGIRFSTSFVGKNGIEFQYECLLTGIDGEELVEVDTKGKKIRSLGRKEPVSGTNIHLSIDSNLQTEVANSMEGKKGAVIVSDTKGSVLAYYSGPSFDPNLLIPQDKNIDTQTGEANQEKLTSLFKDPDLPFFNRVIGGTFHPGSVYKPLVALAALQENAIDKDFTYDDPGVITVNEFSYNNWYFTEYGRKEGTINLARAIARSTDTFFYKMGEKTGPNAIADWSKKFGLDKITGIDLPGEVSGLIPTPEWKKKTKKENWFLGNTYHMSIGQGDVSSTPIEINTYISAISADGRICTPKILQGESACKTVEVKKENLDFVKEGMRQACEQGGTAYTFFDFAATHGGNEVGCKTGTAEVGVTGEPHAWFTLFAPLNTPQIVVTVLVEKGGQGSQVAGPIARKIVDYYFAGSKTSP